MQNLQQQIETFWKDNTAISESREILKTLEESEKEWKEILQSEYEDILSGKNIPDRLTTEQKKKIWKKLSLEEANAVRLKTKYKRSVLYRWASVACLVFLVCLYVYIQNIKPAEKKNAGLSRTPVSEIIEKENLAGLQDKSIALPDRSVVQLSAGSAIRYPEHFGAHARDIQLEGKALFEVSKDPSRPFTVTAGGFSTTALGTRFIVDAQAKNHVLIRLLRGKVVVRTSSVSRITMKPVYLVPGQELNINTELKQFHIDPVSENNTGNPVSSLSRNKHMYNTKETDNNNLSLSFDKAALISVFQALEKHYGIKIVFDKVKVQSLSFTGSFEPSDKLEFALNVICGMNGLSFSKKSDYILITK